MSGQNMESKPSERRDERRSHADEPRPATVAGTALVGSGGEWLAVDQRLCDLLGYGREELLGLALQDVIDPEESGSGRDLGERLLSDGHDAYSTAQRFVRKDGSAVRARVTVSPAQRSSRAPGYFVSIAEEADEREPDEKAPTSDEAKFRFLVQNSSDVLALLRPDASVAYVSPAMERVLGHDPRDRVGRSAFELMHPDDAEGARKLFRDGMHSPGVPLLVEVRMRHADGSWRFMEVTGTNLVSEPAVGGIVVNTRDITQRKLVEEELRAVNEELEAFSYSVSHDLRAPLRSIAGFCRILLEDYLDSLDETGRDYLRRVMAASRRMDWLIDDLLELARVARGDLRREQVDLSAIARGVMEELRREEPGRDVIFSTPKSLEAEGDPRLIKIALENLLGNALKFTRDENPAEIEVDVDAGSGAYLVRDNGAGFEMAYAEKLFAPFGRLHHDEEFEGTGVGLATVARIIRRHGGRIWAVGEPGKGATFYFTLSW